MRSFTPNIPAGAAPTALAIEHALRRPDGPHLPHETLLRFYNSEGGLVTGDQLAYLLGDTVEQPISTVARWIVSRRAICLFDGAHLLLPLFQFDPEGRRIRPAVEQAVRAMRDGMDDWAIASWFARPNAHLDARAPAQAIRQGASSVEDAARCAHAGFCN
jgi:hypothetical protein